MNSQSGNATCKYCAKRHVGCHDNCPEYLEYKRKLALEREAERKVKALNEYAKRSYGNRRRKW